MFVTYAHISLKSSLDRFIGIGKGIKNVSLNVFKIQFG